MLFLNSEERRQARYLRRKAKRKKKQPEFDDIINLDNLIKAHYATRKGLRWKASIIAFEKIYLRRCFMLYRTLVCELWHTLGFNEFLLYTRGKIRIIHSLHYSERVVRRVTCKKFLYVILERSLIYDNGASRKGLGLKHTIKRLKLHLHQYFVLYGNEGYVLKIDLHDFFNSIDVVDLAELIGSKIYDDRLCFLVQTMIIESMGLYLGPEDSQILALTFTSSVDHYIKDELGVCFYARYMDDAYIIEHDKEALKALLEVIKHLYAELGIELNENKTQIIKITNGFTFCKTRYILTDSGKIIMKPLREASVRVRRKLTKLYGLYEQGLITIQSAEQSYMSMRGNFLYRNAWHTTHELDKLFYSLFGFTPWKTADKRRKLKMKRGTTCRHIFRTNVDLTSATVYVSYMQGKSIVIEKTNSDLTIQQRKVIVDLSQEDTLGFKAGQTVSCQIRYILEDGTADASNIITVSVQDVLKDGEISYIAPDDGYDDGGGTDE